SSGQSTNNTTAQNPQSATTTAPQSAQDADANALATLRRWVQHDSSAVGALEGQWIAQLSSKKIGTPADYISWTQVLTNHLYYRQRYPNYALLLWSNDWLGSYGPTSKGFFVTIRGVAFPQPGGVLHWCQHQQWQRGDCFAKRLAKTGDPGANVKMLPGT
ncbi:MAG TPA: hypothetical protein VN108_11215, partial [Marmoricola sp.]|nr:hypothetical protein [Marmoricola sp.]